MSPTALAFRDDAYNRACSAVVVAVDDKGGIVLDRTVFYAQGGGQPGDRGRLVLPDGRVIAIENAVWLDAGKTIVAHLPAAGQDVFLGADAVGSTVTAELDWERRFRLMRMHTALHLLSVALPYPVTGGSVGDGEGRLDFDIPEASLEREAVTAAVNDLIRRDAAVTERWITDEELDANPQLVKTMSVKPPRGSGRVRLVEIAAIDLQPCGGTHVRSTGEIGEIEVTQIEKKGRQNRRVRLSLVS